jgi:hypothetical protein
MVAVIGFLLATTALRYNFANTWFAAPDAMDQMKKAFKGLFKKKSKKEEQPNATPTADKPSSPAPAPATAPEPVKPSVAPASSAPEPAAPAPASEPASAPAPAHDGANKDEVAALAEVKKATQSKSTSPPLTTTHLVLQRHS